MKVKFECTNRACPEKSQQDRKVVLPDELVMDDKNIAVMYCPKCKRKLTRSS